MLDAFLRVALKQEQTKTASRQLTDKLKEFPLDELIALANGDPTSKLAYCGETCGPEGPQSWLDKYKGSALFDKAVQLEKQLLEADASADAKRDEERAADREVDAQRDALRMQKRMLDLDLALEQEGSSGDPEAKEEQGAQLIEQAQAQEAAAGKGGEPHEQAETAALQQFRQAQAQEAAAAPPKAEVKVAGALGNLGHNIRSVLSKRVHAADIDSVRSAVAGASNKTLPQKAREALLAGKEKTKSVGSSIAAGANRGVDLVRGETLGELRSQVKPSRLPDFLGKRKALAGKISEEEKKVFRARLGAGTAAVAGATGLHAALKKRPPPEKLASAVETMIPESRSLKGTVHPERSQGAGQLGDYTNEPSGNVSEGLQVNKTAAVKTALSHTRIIQAVRNTPQKGRLSHAFESGVKALGANKGSVVDQGDTLAQAAAARLKGGNWKRELNSMQALRKAASVRDVLPLKKAPVDEAALRREVLAEFPDLAKKASLQKEALGVAPALAAVGKVLPGAGRRAAAATVQASRSGGNAMGSALRGATTLSAPTGIAGLKATRAASAVAPMSGAGNVALNSASAVTPGMRATSGSALARPRGPLPKPAASPALGSAEKALSAPKPALAKPPTQPVASPLVGTPPPLPSAVPTAAPAAGAATAAVPNAGKGMDWSGMGDKIKQHGTTALNWAQANPKAALGIGAGTALAAGVGAGHMIGGHRSN